MSILFLFNTLSQKILRTTIFFIGLYLLSLSILTAQDNKEIIANLEKTPQLTYNQMLADFDTLCSHIKQISPIVYFNKEVRGIDFDAMSMNLRQEIRPNSTKLEFLHVLQKTIRIAQDGHSSIVSQSLIEYAKEDEGYFEDIEYTAKDLEYCTIYNEVLWDVYVNDLDLKLIYSEGEYYNLLKFKHNNKEYPSLMKVLSCNGIPIHEFVAASMEYNTPLKWDGKKNRFYDENFYNANELFKNNKLKIKFQDSARKYHTINLAPNDSLIFLDKINYDFSFNKKSTSKLLFHFYEEEGIAYIRLPHMEEEYADTIINVLETYIKKSNVNAVVFDVRGNGGGSDNTYMNVLEKLLAKPISINLIVGRNYSPFNQKYYEINRDSIAATEVFTFDAGVPSFKSQEMFFINIPDYEFISIDSSNFNFDGHIYVLQDRFIYSSTSNFSSLAKQSDQITSIGEIPNMLGGLQTDPTIQILPYSRLLYRIEPQIDFTGIQSLEDIFQNHVEIPVSYPTEFIYLRTTSDEDIFNKSFLKEKDPMFKKVLELESK